MGDFVPVDHTCDTILAVAAHTLSTRPKTQIYQCGVIANDRSWDVNECVQYIRPKFVEQELPYCEKNPDVTIIQSKTLFLFVELILYELPLLLLGVCAALLSTVSLYFWLKLYYAWMGLRFQLDAGSKAKSTLTLEEQVRSLEVALMDKPYAFVKRANFMKKARGKLNWFNANYTYFVNQRWCFDHSNVRALFASLDAHSQAKYDFDVDHIAFNQYACDAALVCFRKYIAYRDTKKERTAQTEKALKDKLARLKGELRKAETLTQSQPQPQLHTAALSQEDKLQILHILRKLFFMVGIDAKVSCSVFLGMSMLATLSFFVM